MNLKDTYLTAAVETRAQFNACLGRAGLIYIDSGSFDPSEYAALVRQAHENIKYSKAYEQPEKSRGSFADQSNAAAFNEHAAMIPVGQCDAGTLCALRLPYIWRDKAEGFFDEHLDEIKNAGFDAWLFRNMESLLYFHEKGLLNNTPFITDHSMYVFNSESVKELIEMIPEDSRNMFSSATLPLELNKAELETLNKQLISGNRPEIGVMDGIAAASLLKDRIDEGGSCTQKTGCSGSRNEYNTELVVYGRAPMMVSAQCINKTTAGCDHVEKTLMLADRKNARMPVKNYCRFCYNIIYNAVPTAIFDLTDSISRIAPHSVRYEFTTEDEAKTRSILSGKMPENGSFTRGHLKRGV